MSSCGLSFVLTNPHFLVHRFTLFFDLQSLQTPFRNTFILSQSDWKFEIFKSQFSPAVILLNELKSSEMWIHEIGLFRGAIISFGRRLLHKLDKKIFKKLLIQRGLCFAVPIFETESLIFSMMLVSNSLAVQNFVLFADFFLNV